MILTLPIEYSRRNLRRRKEDRRGWSEPRLRTAGWETIYALIYRTAKLQTPPPAPIEPSPNTIKDRVCLDSGAKCNRAMQTGFARLGQALSSRPPLSDTIQLLDHSDSRSCRRVEPALHKFITFDNDTAFAVPCGLREPEEKCKVVGTLRSIRKRNGFEVLLSAAMSATRTPAPVFGLGLASRLIVLLARICRRQGEWQCTSVVYRGTFSRRVPGYTCNSGRTFLTTLQHHHCSDG
jgi:hypothetical protein